MKVTEFIVNTVGICPTTIKNNVFMHFFADTEQNENAGLTFTGVSPALLFSYRPPLYYQREGRLCRKNCSEMVITLKLFP